MKNASTLLLVVVMFSSLGLWGCTTQQNGAYHSKIRELENRYTKLEEDYKAVVHSSDQLRKKVGLIESQRGELSRKVEELQNIAKERDDLQTQLTACTAERDTLHTQLAQFRKDLQGLLGRMDVALAAPQTRVNALPASRTTQ